MNTRTKKVNISQWKYAVIAAGPRQEIVALTNNKELALDIRGSGACNYVAKTRDVQAFKINGYVGRDHAAKGYITGQFI